MAAAALLQLTRAVRVVQFSSADTLVGGHGARKGEMNEIRNTNIKNTLKLKKYLDILGNMLTFSCRGLNQKIDTQPITTKTEV